MYQEVETILGLKKRKESGPLVFALARSIEEGFPASTIDRLKEDLGVTDRFISALVGKTPKTIGRMREARARLSPLVSDRLYRIAKVYARAIEVFDEAAAAREWLHSPQIGLKERTPLELLMTEAGARAVEDLLMRIEHSVLS
jgi:putative toxin-antitoxin system antitoxin component (TIGR02293 family)